jgi:carbamate kinase
VRIVIALGGNALLHRGERPDAEPQRRNVLQAAEALAPLAGMHELIVTHGNGPQVGVLAMESAADPMLSRPFPLDPLGAETQGLIGYWLMQSLHNVLPDREVVALLTQCVVDGADPAFATPTKFVGPVYDDEVAANALAAQRKWVVARDGNAWRRVVPSPEPREVVEEGVIRRLVDSGVLVVCAGGGGVPVVRHADGTLEGVEAVIDKDLTAALLAERLGADALLLLTDVVAVESNYGQADSSPIAHARAAELRAYGFAAGSMGPKVEAACRFAERTGGIAAIGSLTDAEGVLAGTSGTRVTR